MELGTTMAAIRTNAMMSLSFTIAISLFGIVLIRFAYFLFGHSLSRFPGPLLHRVTGLPTLYHAWKGDLHYHLYELHARYGDYVRYSPNKLSVKNVSALNEIYGFNKNVGKPEEFYSAFRVNKNAINTFNTSSKEDHRRKRRIMAKAFSESALKSYESFIAMQVSGFMKKLANGVEQAGPDQKGQRAFNMAYEFNCLMLDIMGGLCFGEAFGFVSGQGDHIMEQAHKRAFRIYMTGHEPLLRRLYLDRLLFPGLLKASNVLGNYAKMNTLRRIERHRTSGVTTSELYGHEDIMAHLLEAGDEETGTKYTPDELLGEGVLMMMAGSDTSSSTLTATLFYLSFHPNALARVHAELDSRFLTTESINPQEAQSCTYLRACIDEAMRLSPPAPTNIPRLVGEGGIIVTGKPLGTGVYVGVPNFALFRDPRYFDRPHDYIPERWIPAILQDNKDLKAVSAAFQPFSIGPRHCIGRHLAMKEVSFILAHLLYRFDVGPVGSSGILKRDMYGLGKKVVMAQHDVYTSVEGDISVRLRLRKVD